MQLHDQRDAELQVRTAQREGARRNLLVRLDSLDALEVGADSPFAPLFQEWQMELVEALNDLGLVELPADSGSFNPELADGVGTTPPPSGWNGSPYAVARVIRRGFREGNRVYRKARVITVGPPDERDP